MSNDSDHSGSEAPRIASPVYNSTAEEPNNTDILLDYNTAIFVYTQDTPHVPQSVKHWKLFVVLADYRSAKLKHDLSALPEHFHMIMPPPPNDMTFSHFRHKLLLQMGLPYDFGVTPTYWDSNFSRYARLTQATIENVFEGIFKSILAGKHLDSNGWLRGTCCINLVIDYDAYTRYEILISIENLLMNIFLRLLNDKLVLKRAQNKKSRQRKSANKKLNHFKELFTSQHGRVRKSIHTIPILHFIPRIPRSKK